jgi:hypothetical protein
MADIKMGLLGSEVTLPQPQAKGGQPPGMPVGYTKQMTWTTMADGSRRAVTKRYHPRTFSLPWEQLSAADLATLQTLANYNVRLHYQNNWFSAEWLWIRITAFRPNPVVYLGTLLYSAQMDFDEEI